MNYTVYNSNTGEIQYVFSSNDADMVELNLSNRSYIPGDYNSRDYYIVDGSVVSKPEEPSVVGLIHQFDYATKTWIVNVAKSSTASRQYRDQQLALVDRVNPVWYNSLTVEQQSELATYRQALLDVPQQPGFPTQVIWPAKPTWF